MSQAVLYSKHNSLQKTDASFVIDNFLRLMEWRSNDEGGAAILDVGCGDGGVLYDLLLPKLPSNQVAKVVAIDISEEMVKYAQERCKQQYNKVNFMVFDVGASSIPVDFQENFDHIFSFYCLHWVENQRQAALNLFNMLKPTGDMLLTFLASNPIYDIYENVAKMAKWHKYMANLNKYIPPYHHSNTPELDLENLLNEVGFSTQICKVEARSYTFPNIPALRQAVLAIDPFIERIPDNEVNSYIDAYVEQVRKLKNITVESCNNNNEERVIFSYKLFVVFASKSLK